MTLNESDLVTCALISPIMALAPFRYICDENGFVFAKNLVVRGFLGKKRIEQKVVRTKVIQDNKMIVLIL